VREFLLAKQAEVFDKSGTGANERKVESRRAASDNDPEHGPLAKYNA
jgi:hypothetical protein